MKQITCKKYSLETAATFPEHCAILFAQARKQNLLPKAIELLERMEGRVRETEVGNVSVEITLNDALGKLRCAINNASDTKKEVFMREPGTPNFGEEALRFIEAFWS